MALIYPAGDHQETFYLGLSTWGMDDALGQNMILIDTAIGSGGSGVSFFNSRVGAVLPLAGDYASFYLPNSTVLPATFAPVSNEFLTGYTASTGLFTAAQPSAASLSNGVLG